MSGLNKPSAPTGGGLLPPTPTRHPLAPTPMQRPVQRPMQSTVTPMQSPTQRPQSQGFSLIPKASAMDSQLDEQDMQMLKTATDQ